MKILNSKTKFAHLGKPGEIFSKGFERRLNLILNNVSLKNKVILDQACGIGVWLNRLKEFTPVNNLYGFDIDSELIDKFKQNNQKMENSLKIPDENVVVSGAEKLPFESNKFNVVISNEVFEHFNDDVKASAEALRVLKLDGVLIIFTPNRGWPFETHGMFLGDRYIWGNIFLLPWMPKFIRNKLSPHVKNYTNKEIINVVKSAYDEDNQFMFDVKVHTHIFPAFDKIESRFGFLGRIIQFIFHKLEKTPLHFFGISHFIVAKKVRVVV